MKILTSSLLVTVSIFLSMVCYGQHSEWNQFRGPNASGIAARDAKPPLEFGEDKNLLWKIDLPVGSSSPVIWENRIYLTGFIEEKGELQTICIDRNKGEIIWCDSIIPKELEKYHSISNPAPASIAADADGIYVYFASHGLRCFGHEGNLKWEYPLPVPQFNYGHPSSPVIMDEKVILSLDYGDDKTRCLLALNKNTGEIIWKSFVQENTPIDTYGGRGYCTPVRFNNQIILHRSGGVASYSLADGSPIWWIPLLTGGTSTPIVKNNIIYAGAWMQLSAEELHGNFLNYSKFDDAIKDFDKNGDSLISKNEIPEDLLFFIRPEITDIEGTQASAKYYFDSFIDRDKNGLADEFEWGETFKYFDQYVQDIGILALPADLKGELSLKDILWMQLEKTPEVPSPLASDDCIYMVKNGGWVTCMDSQTGKVHFQERLGAPGAYIASPVAANGFIYLPAHNGTINVIEAGKKPKVVFETKLKGKITATPAIAENNLYIRTSELLYAFGK